MVTLNALGITVSFPDWLLIAGAMLLIFYLYATWTHNFFKNRNIPFLKPFPLVGNIKSMVIRDKAIAEIIQSIYEKTSGHRVMGLFELRTPVLLIRDPEIIKVVCVKEFDHFMNHRKTVNEKTDVLFSKSLFALSDKRWRDMRATLSPAFTSSKMKGIFRLISECGRQARDYLEERCREQPGGCNAIMSVEMRDHFTRIATDVIATSAFGVKCDSMRQPKNEFYLMGMDITNITGFKNFFFILVAIIPKLAELLGLSFISKKATQFFNSMVQETIKTRESKGIVRPDMIHLMKEASKAGQNDPTKIKLDEEDIAAQAMLFFFAGFDTVTILMCFTSYLLALHPDVQRKLQEEIDSAFEADGGELSYETLQQMKYLDMVVSETLRIYPPSAVVDRQCVMPLTVPATDTEPSITFEKGDNIWIPIYGLHRDPQHFPNPEKFDPERFSDESKDSIKPFTYMPFGLGPRMCIAQRFAIMEAKVAVVFLLSHFSLHVVDKTPVPLRLSTTSFNTTSADGFWCGVKLRKN